MDRTIVTVSLLLALLVAGCGDAGASATPTSAPPLPSTAPAVATPDLDPPFLVLPPQPAVQALTDERLQHGAYYVLDTATGLTEVIDPDVSPERIAAQGGRAGIRAVWCGDRIEVASIDDTPWVIHPDGRVEQSIAHGCGGPKDSGTSPDGRWSAVVTTSGDVAVEVSDAAGTPVLRVTNAAEAAWPATGGAKLALLGDICAGFHLYLFDPASGALQRLGREEDQVIEYVWRPDGAAIAADVIPADGLAAPYRRVLALIDAVDGSPRELVSLQRDGELIPVGYNASGTRLLFAYNPGRGFCDDGGPPRAPSRLERIGAAR
jgi:hypothetical protein